MKTKSKTRRASKSRSPMAFADTQEHRRLREILKDGQTET
jgi:hypothetical protein